MRKCAIAIASQGARIPPSRDRLDNALGRHRVSRTVPDHHDVPSANGQVVPDVGIEVRWGCKAEK
ncbi:MAG: hypothetical protein ACYCUV_01985 [Phycisphaerae bacterium]